MTRRKKREKERKNVEWKICGREKEDLERMKEAKKRGRGNNKKIGRVKGT